MKVAVLCPGKVPLPTDHPAAGEPFRRVILRDTAPALEQVLAGAIACHAFDLLCAIRPDAREDTAVLHLQTPFDALIAVLGRIERAVPFELIERDVRSQLGATGEVASDAMLQSYIASEVTFPGKAALKLTRNGMAEAWAAVARARAQPDQREAALATLAGVFRLGVHVLIAGEALSEHALATQPQPERRVYVVHHPPTHTWWTNYDPIGLYMDV